MAFKLKGRIPYVLLEYRVHGLETVKATATRTEEKVVYRADRDGRQLFGVTEKRETNPDSRKWSLKKKHVRS
ncbi:hypothetical protein CEXT_220361 [Caerostris extrusa]|uniref:Uncharacterized protein n=1 Tax=Caerostris extrusa TaxID=172846 RepID=A0AAV4TU40_CAEEX|nr:hypothetical protein CEXT_220361 [Caerostris extrusa]